MEHKDIQEMLQHENETWERIFQAELAKDEGDRKDFSSYWWKLYYDEITSFILQQLQKFNNPKLLEAGSGSGKTSLLLGNNFDRTLLDISNSALEYAKHLAVRFNAENITYIQGNIFSMPFNDRDFDLVWNIGVVEHYDPEGIVNMVSEMARVTKSGGLLAVAVPNFKSLPIIKASLLRSKLLSFIPGYRLDSEHGYSEKQILEMLQSGVRKAGRSVRRVRISYFGNPLFMEAPKWLLISLGKFIEILAPKSKFLMMVLIEVE